MRDALVLHLRFDGNADDASGEGLSATINGQPAFDDGQIDQSLLFTDPAEFDHEYVDLGTPAALQFGADTDFTVSVWVRNTKGFKDNSDENGSENDPTIIANKNRRDDRNAGWAIAGTGGGGWQWNLSDGTNQAVLRPDTIAQPITDGSWHHLLVSHDRDGEAVLYYDGAEIARADISSIGDLDSAGLPTVIASDGTYGTDWLSWFDGNIDEVMIWRRSLPAEDVTQIFELGISGNSFPEGTDADGDGLLDSWEESEFGDIAGQNGADDADGEGLNNFAEFAASTDPENPDSDGDGSNDRFEYFLGTDPNDAGSVPEPNTIPLVRSNAQGRSWADGEFWLDGAPPEAGKNYLVSRDGFRLRSPAQTSPASFPGDSLEMQTGTRLLLNHSGNTSATIRLNGGAIANDARMGAPTLSGSVEVISPSILDSNGADTVMTLAATITGDADLTVTQSNQFDFSGGGGDEGQGLVTSVLELTMSNPDFHGDWLISGGILKATATDSLGSGNIVIRGGQLDAGYNVSSPNATLTIDVANGGLVLDQTFIFQDLIVGEVSLGEVAAFGAYDYDTLTGLDPAFEDFLTDGGGVIIIVGTEGGDSDLDGLLDDWENENFGGLDESFDGDPDGDGLPNRGEFAAGSDPNNADSDGDQLSDGDEVSLHGSDPTKTDTDADTIDDFAEVNSDPPTNPAAADTDGDGLTDPEEINGDPATNPTLADTDGDGADDKFELDFGFDPNDGSTFPRIKFFGFDDGTFQGWETVLGDPEELVFSVQGGQIDSSPDPSSGNFRVIPEPFSQRDPAHPPMLVRSPEFQLTADGPLSVDMTGGSGGELPGSPADLERAEPVAGMGYGLRRVSDDTYVITKRRDNNDALFVLTVTPIEELQPFVSEEDRYTLDIFDSYSGGWGWIGFDSVTIPGIFAGDEVPVAVDFQIVSIVPGAADNEFEITWNSSVDETYTVEYSADLQTAWEVLVADIAGEEGSTMSSVTLAAGPRGFVRVRRQ